MKDSEKTKTVFHGGIFMPQKTKATPEEKVLLIERCLRGELSQAQASRAIGITQKSFCRWVKKYEAEGTLAFLATEHNRVYSNEIKLQAVTDYLSGTGSLLDICKKYKIRSDKQLRAWLKVYNSGKEFRHKMSGGSRMKTGRKASQEERIKIVKDCLEGGSNYGEIAQKYNVSYQQVYTWVKKFRVQGEAGLEDRRGKRTAAQTARTPEEELRIRIAQLEHENYMLKMERDVLKKLEEIERRDAFRK